METKALLVEDNRVDFLRIRAFIQAIPSNDISLDWLDSYEKGYLAMVENSYDIYLLDYRLGGRDGLALLSEAIRNGCHKPVILLTGFADIQLDITAMECGAVDFLEKDKIDSAQLERAIRYATQNWKVRCELEASLKEKETLLKEIHHRVKNNLQVIASMFRLHMRKLSGQLELELFQDCCNRIHSIALVHDQLYRTDRFDAVNFSDYLQSLVGQLHNVYGADPDRIRIELRVDSSQLSITHAIPCGLILHELISNALRHAFPDGRKGSIIISVERDSEAVWHLVVSDDGIGTTANDDSEGTSIGLELVKAFVDQLDAEIELKSGPGTEWHIRFSED